MTHEPRRNGIWAVLRQRNFRRYVIGNGLSLIGTWMQRIAVGWLTWELTHSPAWLGIIALADFFPVVLMGPLGGALADRYSLVRVMALAQTAAACSALSLFGLAVSGVLNEYHLALFTCFSGTALGLNQASRLALAPRLVPREMLTTAIAVNSMVFNSARFVGPMISTAVISLWSIDYSFLINALSFTALIVALLSLDLPKRPARQTDGVPRSMVDDILEGLAFVRGHVPIRLVIAVLTMTAVCLRPVIEMLPGLTSKVYGQGADEFAVLTACFGVGAILGGFWMARRGGIEDQAVIALLGIAGAAAAGIGMVATTSYVVALPVAMIAGAATVISGIGMQSTLQFVTPAAIRGRVMSLFGVIHIGGAGAGALLMGMAAEVLGLRVPVAAAAVLGMTVWVAIWRRRAEITASLASPPGPEDED